MCLRKNICTLLAAYAAEQAYEFPIPDTANNLVTNSNGLGYLEMFYGHKRIFETF